MASARPLRDVFADLTGSGHPAGDPAALLRDQGHPALPDDLVAEAVVSYADTAPVEVAEHLAPYVTAHSVVGGDESPAGWLDLMGTAPAGAEPAGLDDLGPASGASVEAADPGPGLDFGTGAEIAAGTGTDPEDPGDDVAGPADGELVEALDPVDLGDGDAADWTAADPSTVDDAEPDDGPDDGPLG